MKTKSTILIADDRPDNVELVRDVLTMEGYQVVVAVDGQQALDRIREYLPDLVLLDLDMPRLNGYQVCEQLKADPATAGIPILMLTAWSAPDQRVKGLQLGAEDYMAKPFDYRELQARVKARLRAKQEADHLREMQQSIRQTFERYVPVHVVEQLLANPTEVSLGGRQQEVTALFADLRGYTTLSESLSVEELVDVLNGHLTVAARAVLAYEGTISQYAGDLVMAIFNAPLAQSDHALRAARAAQKLQADVASYHALLPAHLRMEFGIGIASGPAVVGNIGAYELLHYTAIGDTINLAQRLEEMAPGGHIFMTERTCRLLGCGAQVECRGPVAVRGRSEPVSIYALVDLDGAGL
jgi:class 3 adenylate cyclase